VPKQRLRQVYVRDRTHSKIGGSLKMTPRQTALENMKSHPVLKNLFKKLSKSEMQYVEDFIKTNDLLSNADFAHKVNRLFIDGDKPKHHVDMWSILNQIK